MPTRNDQQTPQRTVASQPAQQTARPNRAQAPQQGRPQSAAPLSANTSQEDDEAVWQEIMDMKNQGDNSGFDKMNTAFYLKDGEECKVVLIDELPILFNAHTIKCISSKGKPFYRMEQCQKASQSTCVMCDSMDTSIGKAKSAIAFRLLDERGKTDRNGNFDWIPAPKIFIAPIYAAKQIKTLKDELGGAINSVVLKVVRNSNYIFSFHLEKSADGRTLQYVDAPEYNDPLPEVLDVYAVADDRDLLDFMHRFVSSSIAAPAAPAAGQPTAAQQMGNRGGFGAAPQQQAQQTKGRGFGR